MNIEPVPIELGEHISRVVKDFADANGLDSHLWYQDQPLWFVRREDENITRQVQVAVFRKDGKRLLFFTPQAYAYEGNNVRLAAEETAEKTVSLPFLQLLGLISSSETEEEKKRKASLRSSLVSSLQQAWDTANAVREEQLTNV